mmetsp:Transcript_105777/g.326247  ORF Transcript_105777/g.326247 Transcript_105777/m.326247 type:complete len:252 (+) Transcript_105777:2238-2993(+)
MGAGNLGVEVHDVIKVGRDRHQRLFRGSLGTRLGRGRPEGPRLQLVQVLTELSAAGLGALVRLGQAPLHVLERLLGVGRPEQPALVGPRSVGCTASATAAPSRGRGITGLVGAFRQPEGQEVPSQLRGQVQDLRTARLQPPARTALRPSDPRDRWRRLRLIEGRGPLHRRYRRGRARPAQRARERQVGRGGPAVPRRGARPQPLPVCAPWQWSGRDLHSRPEDEAVGIALDVVVVVVGMSLPAVRPPRPCS